MKIGMSSWSLLSLEVTDAIKRIGEAGYDSIELWGEEPHAYYEAANVQKIRDALSSFSMEVTAHAPFHDLNIGCTYQDVLETTARKLSEFVDFARKIGATQITFHPGNTYDSSLTKYALRSSIIVLKRLRERASNTVHLNIENQYGDRLGYNFSLGGKREWIDEMLREVDDLGMTIDTGHANINNQDPKDMLEQYKNKVRCVHFNNNRGIADEHSFPADGTLNMSGFITVARKMKDLTVTFEVNPFRYKPKEVLQLRYSLK
ncbi:MAG: sugar phosphate isomerase/epimerase [Nitrososphaerota archaeon]